MDIIDLRDKLPKVNRHIVRRKPSQITMIAVHHVGDGRVWSNTYDAFKEYVNEANYHINKDWGGGYFGNGLQYHYKIARDGKVYRTRDIEEITWHAMNANPIAVAVCLDGDLTLQDPTAAQIDALEELLNELRNWLHIPQGRVFGHGELKQYGNSTQCPGRALSAVIRYRDTGVTRVRGAAIKFDVSQHLGKAVVLPNGATYIITNEGKKVLSPDVPTFYAFGYLLEDRVPLPNQDALDSVPDGDPIHFPSGQYRKMLQSIKANRKEFEGWFNSK